MRRLFKILSAISIVLSVVTAVCWALSAMGYQRALVRAEWDDRPTNIQLYISALGWRQGGVLHGNVIYQWSASSAQSLDPMRELLRKRFGECNQKVRQWAPLPEFPLMPLGGGTVTGGEELYEAPFLKLTFGASVDLVGLAGLPEAEKKRSRPGRH